MRWELIAAALPKSHVIPLGEALQLAEMREMATKTESLLAERAS
jgi:hypothetical protein